MASRRASSSAVSLAASRGASTRSALTTLSKPALVTTAALRGLPSGKEASQDSTASKSPRLSHTITPARWSRAFCSSQSPARAPVWLEAAAMPAWLRPPLYITTRFPWDTSSWAVRA